MIARLKSIRLLRGIGLPGTPSHCCPARLLSTGHLSQPRPLCYDLAPAKLPMIRDFKAKDMIGG
jgi:hypothetical protein